MPNNRLLPTPIATAAVGPRRASIPPEECQICSYKFTQRTIPHRAKMSICACRSSQPCFQHSNSSSSSPIHHPPQATGHHRPPTENDRPPLIPTPATATATASTYWAIALTRLLTRDPDRTPRYPCTLTCGHTICEPCAGECVVLDSKMPLGLLLEVVRHCQRERRPPELFESMRPLPRCPLCRVLIDVLDWPIEETMIALKKRLVPLMFEL